MPSVAVIVALCIGGGAAFVFFLGIVYATLYKKTTSNRSFVRTGSGGAKVYMDSGGVVIPIMHKLTWISQETMKLEIARIGKDALITRDKLRADVEAQFYVKVPPEKEQILAAARSLGQRATEVENVKELIKDKLISALRSVSATKALMELHEDREGFGMDVFNALKDDLRANGLQLETVAISQLDMTKKDFFDKDNYFDAQGLKLMTDTIETAKKEENDIRRQRDLEIEKVNVEADKQTLDLQKERQLAIAEQERDVSNEQAERKAETEKFRLNQEREVKEAEVAKNYAVEKAGIDKDIKLVEENKRKEEAEVARKQAIEEVEVGRKLAIEQANIEREKSTETARIVKEIALIEENKRKEEAEVKRQQVVEEAEVQRNLVVEEANVKRERAIESARIEKEKAVEIAQVEKEIKIVEEVKLKEQAETERLRVAAEKEEAETERAKVEANREAEIELIDVRKAAEENKVKQQVAVDVEAYEIQKRATAKFEASEKEAQAIERLAAASLKEAESEAEGQRKLIEARNEISDALLHQEILLNLVKVSPELMDSLMSPAEKISDIKVLNITGMGEDNGGNSVATNIIDTILKTGAALPVLQQLMQFSDLDDLAKKVPGLKNVLAKVKEKEVDVDVAE